MKLLLIGSDSIHVKNYITYIRPHVSEIVLITEQFCNFEGINRQHVIPFRLKNIFTFIRNYKIIAKEICSSSGLIHIHQINRLAIIAILANKLCVQPVLTTAWGSDVLIVPKKNWFYTFLVRFVLINSKICTADSKDIIHEINKMSPTTRCEWLQYGFNPVNPKIKENIIYSNRLHKAVYRIDAIINYFESFSRQYPDWKLVIAGNGVQTHKLIKQVETLKLESKIEFVGWLNDDQNREWYAKSKIFVSIPKSDGTSVSVLEAMSAECVLVLSDLPVTHEWISVKTGVIEQPEINPLIKAIAFCDSTILSQNKEFVDSIASRENSIQKFLHLYKEISKP